MRLLARLRDRPDSEHEQATIRLILGSLMVAYVVATYDAGGDGVSRDLVVRISAGFLSASALLLIAIILNPAVSKTRRVIGIVHDMCAITTALALAGESGAPLLGVYLWVMIGNGFRFGPSYMLLAAVLGILGCLLVFTTSPFWARHPMFSISFLVVLVMIPAYAAALINKLNEAIHRANEASLAKSQFLAKMSHELRTPLNGVIGMADLLLDSDIERRHEDHARSIRSSADTLLGIIENILDFSKIEAGGIEIESIDFDLHRLISDSVQMFKPLAKQKDISVRLRVDPQVPFSLRGDPLHLRQILMNLLGNAVKFTDKGWVELGVALAADGADAGSTDARSVRVRFTVSDTGIGIEEKDQAHIFESFRQASSATTRLFGGTGLGTAIARELAMLMGGEIGVESELGKGSSFWIEIPFQLAEPPLAQAQSFGRMLVVGEPATTRGLCEHLDTWGAVYDTADGLISALGAVLEARRTGRELSAMLVVAHGLDVAPAELVAAVRSERSLSSLAVVLIDSAGAEGTSESPVHDGFAAVLHEPVDKVLLFNALHALGGPQPDGDNVASLADHYRRVGGAPAGGLHVLVADDNETNRRVLEQILKRIGHRATIVENGELALDQLDARGDDFDLLIFDKSMPVRTGVEALNAYRFMVPPERAVPAIVLTADATQAGIDECMQAGFDAYLTKPVDSRKLLETIARLCPPEDAAREPALEVEQAPEGQAKQGDLVDRDKLQWLTEISNEQGFLRELIDGFINDSARSIERMAEAVAEDDYPKLRESIHALRGSAGEMGTTRLLELAMKLRALKPFELDSDEARACIEHLRSAHAATAKQLIELAERYAQRA